MGSLKISGMDIDKYSANLSVDLADIKVNDSTYSHSYTNNAGSGKSINAMCYIGFVYSLVLQIFSKLIIKSQLEDE